ncbi:MAG: hypothetical protein KBA51_02500 [Kiritimatiellae bacterium]|nr:hypothetical protein [Kiritimatiellia bacterium]
MNPLRIAIAAAWTAALLGLTACATTPKPAAWTTDETLARHAAAAQRSLSDGNLDAAAAQYTQALHRARALDDAESVAVMSYNLAACAYQSGDFPATRLRITEARATAPGFSTLALRLLEARVALAEGRADAAAALLAAEEDGATPMTRDERAVKSLLLAAIDLDRGQSAAAAQHLESARGALAKSPPALRAEAEEVQSRLAAGAKNFTEAAAAMERAAALWAKAGRAGPVAEALASAAALRSDAGEDARALELEYRAARAAHATGRDTLARGLLDCARRRPGAEANPWKPLLDELGAALPPSPAEKPSP